MAIQPKTIALINVTLIICGCIGLLVNEYIMAVSGITILLFKVIVILGTASQIILLLSIFRC